MLARKPSPIETVANDDAEADAEGLADLDAGRVVSGEAVKLWLRSWGSSDELPAPQLGE